MKIPVVLLSLFQVFFLPYAAASDDSCSQKTLHEKSQYLFNRDQSLRSQYELKGSDAKYQQELRDQDKENQLILDEIVDRCGWPENDGFYNSLLETALLIVLHAPHYYQEKYYDNIYRSYVEGKIPKTVYAVFENRFDYTRRNFRK